MFPFVKQEIKEIKEDCLLITKTHIDKLAQKALSEVYEYLTLEDEDEENTEKEFLKKLKKTRKKLKNGLIVLVKGEKKNKVKFTYDDDEKLEIDSMEESLIDFYLSEVEKRIRNKSFDTDSIYEVLDSIEFDFEMEEDAFFKRILFLQLYDLFHYNYTELED